MLLCLEAGAPLRSLFWCSTSQPTLVHGSLHAISFSTSRCNYADPCRPACRPLTPSCQAENELLRQYQSQLLEKEHSGCAALLRDDKVGAPGLHAPCCAALCLCCLLGCLLGCFLLVSCGLLSFVLTWQNLLLWHAAVRLLPRLCAVPCCALLWYAVLCHAVLCCGMLWSAVLCCAVRPADTPLPWRALLPCSGLQKSDLARMYKLFRRIPKGLDPMADIFKKHVEEEGE